jgi:hypothetical protein
MIDEAIHEGRKCWIRVITREILVVAAYTYRSNWKAYIGIVEGKNHAFEWQRVLETGDALGEDLARFLFPDFKDPYDR